MIRINLLPFRAARKKENIRRQVSIFFLCLLLVVIVLGWVHFYLGSKQKNLTTNVADTKKELALYKKKNAEIKEIRKKLEDLEKRQNVIQDVAVHPAAGTACAFIAESENHFRSLKLFALPQNPVCVPEIDPPGDLCPFVPAYLAVDPPVPAPGHSSEPYRT